MSVFARLVKEARQADVGKPQNVYQQGRSVRFAKPLSDSEIQVQLSKYAGDRDYRVYNDFLRFGGDKAVDTAIERNSFREDPFIAKYQDRKKLTEDPDEKLHWKLNIKRILEEIDQQGIGDLYKPPTGSPITFMGQTIGGEVDPDKVGKLIPNRLVKRLNTMGITDVPEAIDLDDVGYYADSLRDLSRNLNTYFETIDNSNQNWVKENAPIYGRKTEEIAKKDILAIDKSLRQLPENVAADFDGSKVQRGMHFKTEEDRQKFLDDVLFGGYADENTSYWQDPSFHSVTTDPSRVEFFSKRNGEYPVIIDYDTSIRYPNMTFNEIESESIYPPDTWFEVMESYKDPNGVERLKFKARYDDPRAERIHRSITPDSYDRRIQERQAIERAKFNERYGKKSLDELLTESDGNGIDFSKLQLDVEGSKELQELLGF